MWLKVIHKIRGATCMMPAMPIIAGVTRHLVAGLAVGVGAGEELP